MKIRYQSLEGLRTQFVVAWEVQKEKRKPQKRKRSERKEMCHKVQDPCLNLTWNGVASPVIPTSQSCWSYPAGNIDLLPGLCSFTLVRITESGVCSIPPQANSVYCAGRKQPVLVWVAIRILLVILSAEHKSTGRQGDLTGQRGWASRSPPVPVQWADHKASGVV